MARHDTWMTQSMDGTLILLGNYGGSYYGPTGLRRWVKPLNGSWSEAEILFEPADHPENNYNVLYGGNRYFLNQYYVPQTPAGMFPRQWSGTALILFGRETHTGSPPPLPRQYWLDALITSDYDYSLQLEELAVQLPVHYEAGGHFEFKLDGISVGQFSSGDVFSDGSETTRYRLIELKYLGATDVGGVKLTIDSSTIGTAFVAKGAAGQTIVHGKAASYSSSLTLDGLSTGQSLFFWMKWVQSPTPILGDCQIRLAVQAC